MEPSFQHSGGAQRWHEWLTVQLSPHEVLRESLGTPQRNGLTWRVKFPDSGVARVHVGPDALLLDREEFTKATGRIIEYGMLEELQAAEAGILLIGDVDRIEVLV